MRVNIFPIVSSLHEENRINEDTNILLNELIKMSKHQFNITNVDDLYDADLSLILIQSGGSEGLFLENFNNLKEPYYLLTYGHNNSLAASLEILSYIKDNNLKGEVLHGDTDYLVNRIDQLLNSKQRLGVIGKPSDWLIASKVDYFDALKYHNVELVDIDINKVVEYYQEDYGKYNVDFDYDKKEVDKAIKLHQVLGKIKEEYNLSGLTIRCFDLLEKLKTTACLSLALFNSENTIGTCEGDIPTMISMNILRNITNQSSFQANPSRIDVTNNKMILAHCTLPFDMVVDYSLDTHFESGIGVAVRGKLKEEVITIFKLSRNLCDYYVSTGKIIKNLSYDNLCRTQIEIEVDNINYFLTRPYGNHHVVVYGDHKDEIEKYMDKLVK